jgi:hypothetical protein
LRFPLFISFLFVTTLSAYGQDELAWLTTDFTTGGFVLQHPGECETTELDVEVAGDAVVRSQNGYIFVINRYGYDNITVLSASNPEEVLVQFSTGNGSNPQDILIVEGQKAYVTILQSPEVLIVDFLAGEITGQIDLSAFADEADGIPEATHVIPDQDHILVMCQRLDQTTDFWDPAGPGCLAVIDPASDSVVDVDPSSPGVDPIWLPFGNPTSWARTLTSLLVTCVGNWSLYDDGALVAIDPIGETAPETLVTESTANGNIYEVASIVNAVYVAISYPDWSYAALPYYLDPGTLGQALFGTSGGYIPDLLAHQAVLYIADQGTSAEPELAGLILVDADIDSFICGPVTTGLPPSSGAAVQPFGSDENPFVPRDLKLARIWPNPAQQLVRVELTSLERDGMHVSLYDLTGRMVGKKSSSEHTTVMRLNDTTGRSCAPGSYILRVEAVGAVEDHSLVIRR